MKQQTGLQYSSFERHREAMVIRRDCVATMGYEVVVPKKCAKFWQDRRCTNVYDFEDGAWRPIARQATNVCVQ